jgi:hypothetical protein
MQKQRLYTFAWQRNGNILSNGYVNYRQASGVAVLLSLVSDGAVESLPIPARNGKWGLFLVVLSEETFGSWAQVSIRTAYSCSFRQPPCNTMKVCPFGYQFIRRMSLCILTENAYLCCHHSFC